MRESPVVAVNIRNIAVGGAGVGEVTAQDGGGANLLGITAFVPFSAPGELVQARVIEEKERFVNAELMSVLEPSPARVEPKCPYFRICGGCELEHMSPESQRAAKREMIRGALQAAKFSKDVLDVLQPVVGQSDYGYRRRVTLHVDSSGKIGFYRSASRSIVAVQCCPISVPSIESRLSGLQSLGEVLKGKVSSLILEADEEKEVAVFKAPYALSKTEESSILAGVSKWIPHVVLITAGKEAAGMGSQILNLPLNESGSMKMRIPAGSFSQVNWAVNLELVAAVVKAAGEVQGKKVLDLYAGAGNFSLPLARAGARVSAVECDPRLVAFGRQNAKQLRLEKNLCYFEASVERFLEKDSDREGFFAIVLDPPRSGIGALAHRLPRSFRLVSVFCHLPSFVRDLRTLLDLGWNLEKIQPFDMFPQTSAVEILAVFGREY